MTKKEALQKSAEEVRVQYHEAHEAINEVFDRVRSSFLEADTELEIVARNSWNREITGRITNKVMQWSSEVVRFDLIPLKSEDKFELKFNYGSGGWNDGIDAQRQLMFMSDCLRAVCLSQNIANDSFHGLTQRMDKFFELQNTLSDIQSDIRDIENAEKKAEEDVKRKEILAQLTMFDKAKTGQEYVDFLKEQDSYKVVRLAYVDITSEGELRFRKKELSCETYSKAVYKVDGSRSSYKDIVNMDFSNYIEIPRELWYAGVLNHFRSMTLEQVFENYNNFLAQKEEE